MAQRTSTEVESNIIKDYVEGHLGSSTIAKKYNMNAGTVCNILARNGIKRRSNRDKSLQYVCEDNYFKVIDTEHKAYWLGFLLADGYVSIHNNSYIVGLSLSVKDRNHILKFKEDIKATYNIKEYISNGFSACNYCRIIISSPIMVNDLITHGVVEHKTNIMKPPLNVPNRFIKDCIRGYFDGNGCITYSVYHIRPSFTVKICATEDILLWIKDFAYANNVCFSYKPYKRKAHQSVSQLDIGGNLQAQKFLDLLYQDSTVYLDRKYKLYQSLCEINLVVPS